MFAWGLGLSVAGWDEVKGAGYLLSLTFCLGRHRYLWCFNIVGSLCRLVGNSERAFHKDFPKDFSAGVCIKRQ